MKSRLFIVALLVCVIGFSGCPGSKEKSSEKAISVFKVNGKQYQVNENANPKTINFKYDKLSAGTWDGMPSSAMAPDITWNGAKIEPEPSVAQNFHIEGFTVKYKETAEDGTFVEYTVIVDREPTL